MQRRDFSTQVVDVKPHASLVAVAFPRLICVWSDFGHHIPRCESGPLPGGTLAASDALQQLAWHPSGDRLAALTRHAQVIIFVLEDDPAGGNKLRLLRVPAAPGPLGGGASLAVPPLGETSMGGDGGGLLVGAGGPTSFTAWSWGGDSRPAGRFTAAVQAALGTAAASPPPAFGEEEGGGGGVAGSQRRVGAAPSRGRVPAAVVRRGATSAAPRSGPATPLSSPTPSADPSPAAGRVGGSAAGECVVGCDDLAVCSRAGVCVVVAGGGAALLWHAPLVGVGGEAPPAPPRSTASPTPLRLERSDDWRTQSLADALADGARQPAEAGGGGGRGLPCARLRVHGAERASVSRSRALVAVGCTSGEVVLFALPPAAPTGASAVIAPAATLSLAPWGIGERMSGPVGALAFSFDGGRLAVGWRGPRGGLAVFSSAGALVAAWPSVTAQQPAGGAPSAPPREGPFGGAGSACGTSAGGGGLAGEGRLDPTGPHPAAVTAVAWAGEDASVFVGSRTCVSSAASGACGSGAGSAALCADVFADGPSADCSCAGERHSVFRFDVWREASPASARVRAAAAAAARPSPLLLLGRTHALVSSADPHRLLWRRLSPPLQPSAAGPGLLRRGAVSPDGRRVALAAARGVAVRRIDEAEMLPADWRVAFDPPARRARPVASASAASLCVEELRWLEEEDGACDVLLAIGRPSAGVDRPGVRRPGTWGVSDALASVGFAEPLPTPDTYAARHAGTGPLELRALDCGTMRLLLHLPLPVRGVVWGCSSVPAAPSLLALGCEQDSGAQAICLVTITRSPPARLHAQAVRVLTPPHPAASPLCGLSCAAVAPLAAAAHKRTPLLELLLLSSDGRLSLLRFATSCGGAAAPSRTPLVEPIWPAALPRSQRVHQCWHLAGAAWAEEERSTWFYRWDGGGLTASTRPGEEDREVEAVVASGPGSVHFTEWQGESTVTCEIPLLPQQREVAPVAILPDCHALIGIGPPELNAAQLGPPLVAQPLLHRSLRWLLTHQRRAAAERLARGPGCFRRRHCLERLLHEATVEAHKSCPLGEGARPLLSDVALLLLRALLPAERSRVIAGCAPLSEPSHWPVLFRACGTPDELLRASLAAGDTRGAMLLLLPVLVECGVSQCEAALRAVRQAALSAGQPQTIADVERFERRLTAAGAGREAVVS